MREWPTIERSAGWLMAAMGLGAAAALCLSVIMAPAHAQEQEGFLSIGVPVCDTPEHAMHMAKLMNNTGDWKKAAALVNVQSAASVCKVGYPRFTRLYGSVGQVLINHKAYDIVEAHSVYFTPALMSFPKSDTMYTIVPSRGFNV